MCGWKINFYRFDSLRSHRQQVLSRISTKTIFSKENLIKPIKMCVYAAVASYVKRFINVLTRLYGIQFRSRFAKNFIVDVVGESPEKITEKSETNYDMKGSYLLHTFAPGLWCLSKCWEIVFGNFFRRVLWLLQKVLKVIIWHLSCPISTTFGVKFH